MTALPKRRIAVLAVLLVAAGGGIWFWFSSEESPHPVLPVQLGAVYRSGRLPVEVLAEEIRKRNIRVVVNLGDPYPEEAELCRRLGVKYLEIPVGDVWTMCGVPAPGSANPSAYDLSQLWSVFQRAEQEPVLVHCNGGVHRTGVAVAMYRIRFQGWDAEDAIRELDLFGFESHKGKFALVLDCLRGMEPGEARRASTAGVSSQRH